MKKKHFITLKTNKALNQDVTVITYFMLSTVDVEPTTPSLHQG